jgi:hypothetical protein
VIFKWPLLFEDYCAAAADDRFIAGAERVILLNVEKAKDRLS